jgi:hypothetical protein
VNARHAGHGLIRHHQIDILAGVDDLECSLA